MSTLAVRGIVVHVSASAFGDAKQIDAWHKQKGWAGIGYHRVILNGVRRGGQRYDGTIDGRVEQGRPDTVQGAHCAARQMNRVTLGVCCIGSPGFVPAGAPPAPAGATTLPYLTAKQHTALVAELAAICRARKLDPLGTFVHPVTKATVPVITQHSMHDAAKPVCASLHMGALRQAVAAALRA